MYFFFTFVFVCFMLNFHAAFVGFKCQSRGIARPVNVGR